MSACRRKKLPSAYLPAVNACWMPVVSQLRVDAENDVSHLQPLPESHIIT